MAGLHRDGHAMYIIAHRGHIHALSGNLLGGAKTSRHANAWISVCTYVDVPRAYTCDTCMCIHACSVQNLFTHLMTAHTGHSLSPTKRAGGVQETPHPAPAGQRTTALRAATPGVRMECEELRILPQGPRPGPKGTSESTFLGTWPRPKRNLSNTCIPTQF